MGGALDLLRRMSGTIGGVAVSAAADALLTRQVRQRLRVPVVAAVADRVYRGGDHCERACR